MTLPSAISIGIGSIFVLVICFMGYKLARTALYMKGDVDVEMGRGKTVFKLRAKERSSGK